MNINLKDLGIKTDELKNLVVDRIVDQITSRNSYDDEGRAHAREDYFIDEIRNETSKAIQASAHEVVEKHLSSTVDELINGEFRAVDNWGSPKGDKTTLRDVIKKRADEYLNEKVNSNGSKDTYHSSTTRIEYLVNEQIKTVFTREFKTEITKAVESAKATLQRQVAQYISEQLLEAKK